MCSIRAHRAATTAAGRRQWNFAGQEQGWDVGQKDRHEIGGSLLDGASHRRAGKERNRAEALAMRRIDKRRWAGRVEVVERDVAQASVAHQCLEQRRGGGRRAVDEDTHAALQRPHRLVGADGVLEVHEVAVTPDGAWSFRAAEWRG
jgi:hypothetical protein